MAVNNRTVIVRLRAEMDQYKREMRQAEEYTRRLEGQMRSGTDTLKKLALTGVGLTATWGLKELISDSVQLEAAYSKTMAQVAVATGAPAAELQRLDDLAMQLGADTVFSAQDASAAMLELAKGGLTTAQIEAGALAETLTLASAGGLDLGVAANTVVQAMGAFGLSAEQTGVAVAALAGAANASSADVGDITQALAQAGTSANAAGLSIQETTAFLGMFADSGIKGSDAGTSLRTMLSRLVPQTKDAAGAMEKLGLSYVDANGELVGAEEIAARTQKAFQGLTDEQRIAAANTIFGADAQRAVNVLTEEGAEGLREYVEATSDLTQAQKLADAANSGTAGAMEQLSGAVETAKIQLGKGLAPVIQDVAGDLSHLLEDGDIEGWAEGAGRYVQDLIDDLEPLAESGLELGQEVFPIMADAGGLVVDVLTLAADVITPLLDGFNKLPDSAQQALILAAGAQQLSKRLGPVDGLAARAGDSVLLFGGNAEKGGDKAKRADRKFAGLASTLKGMGVLALAGFALPAVGDEADNLLNFIDRLKDGSAELAETMDRDGRKTETTLLAIQDALGSGSTGKYAEDLGIDLDRLAESLAEGGKGAQYARDVLRDLEDQMGGSSEILGDFTPLWETNGEKAAAFSGDLKDLIAELDEAQTKASRTGESLNDLAIDLLFADGNTRGLAAQLKEMPPEVKTAVLTPGAIESTKDVRTLAETYKLTPEQVTTVMQALDFATKDIDKVVSEMEKADGKQAKTKVTADTSQARVQVQWTEDALRRLGGSEASVYVNANTRKALADAYAARARIDGLTASIYVAATGPGLHVSQGGRGGTTTARAGGGGIFGPGGPRDDLVPVLASNNEHMWTAAEVEALGGHGAMYALRTAVRGGWRPQFAVGGAISDAWDTSYRAAAAAYSYTPTTSLSGASAPPTIGPLSASADLAGGRLAFDTDGFLRFVDGRIDVAISADQAYSSATRRAGGR